MKDKYPGQVFVKDDSVFRLDSYCDSPTETYQNIANGHKIGGGVGCPNFEGLKPISDLDKEELIKRIEFMAFQMVNLVKINSNMQNEMKDMKIELLQLKLDKIESQSGGIV